ncbi:MAG: hypothetical protein QXO21_00430 [Candidatus Anstonellales archaeon]
MSDTEFDDYTSSANMEIRLITLELMKLAFKKKKSFKQITKEYLKNAEYLKEALTNRNTSLLIVRPRHKKQLKDEESKG